MNPVRISALLPEMQMEAQGQRIGQQLMEHYCRQLDPLRRTSYLETDRPGNVTFYRRFGFEILQQEPVPGVPNFFMFRRAKSI